MPGQMYTKLWWLDQSRRKKPASPAPPVPESEPDPELAEAARIVREWRQREKQADGE